MEMRIYRISNKPNIALWLMSNAADPDPLYELNKVYHRPSNQFSSEEYFIYLPAIDPISAFCRGCNILRDRMEE